MKLTELVTAAKAGKQKVFQGLDDKRIARVVQTVLAEAGRQLTAAKEGKLDLKGFGRFVIKQAEVEKDGQKVQKKRITFRPAKAKGEGKKGGKKGGKGGGKGAGKGAGKRGGKGKGAGAADAAE